MLWQMTSSPSEYGYSDAGLARLAAYHFQERLSAASRNASDHRRPHCRREMGMPPATGAHELQGVWDGHGLRARTWALGRP